MKNNDTIKTSSMAQAILNGKKIYAFPDKKALLSFIQDKHGILVAMNAEKIMNPDPGLKRIINNNFGYADGSGAVLALKQKGKQSAKIPGTEFWQDMIRQFAGHKSFYLIGSSDDVIEQTVQRLQQEYPTLEIVNYRNGFLEEQSEIDTLKEDICRQKPDVVFVAMGSPKQEYLMEELLQSHPALYMGLGGSFDIYSGLKKRAPQFFLKLHLEWLYRLLKEPTRISRQIKLARFFILVLFKRL